MMDIVYASAVVLYDQQQHKVLIAKRPEDKIMPGYWEFPGGKVDEGELPEDALKREGLEELGVSLERFSPLSFISECRETYHVVVYVFVCAAWQGEPEGKEGQEIKWIEPKEVKACHMLPSNKPLFPYVESVEEYV